MVLFTLFALSGAVWSGSEWTKRQHKTEKITHLKEFPQNMISSSSSSSRREARNSFARSLTNATPVISASARATIWSAHFSFSLFMISLNCLSGVYFGILVTKYISNYGWRSKNRFHISYMSSYNMEMGSKQHKLIYIFIMRSCPTPDVNHDRCDKNETVFKDLDICHRHHRRRLCKNISRRKSFFAWMRKLFNHRALSLEKVYVILNKVIVNLHTHFFNWS